MPCDTVSTVQVKLDAKVTNRGLLDHAMKSLGIDSYSFASNGSLEFRDNGNNVTVAQIKVAYSKEVIKSQAQRFGWRVAMKGNENKLTVMKARL